MRTKQEIQARIDIIRCSGDVGLSLAFDEAEEATRGMSPSSAFTLANQMSRNVAVAKAVRWQRILERDFKEN